MPDPGGVGGVRIGIALDDVSLEPFPDWTYLTATDNLVASYSIDRGRAYETDKTDTGTATVEIIDRDGVLDPTNTTGPYWGKLEPLLQVQIELLNPLTDTWQSRFRGFVEDFDYDVDPTQQLGRLRLGLVDLFAILTRIEMQPAVRPGHPTEAAFGDYLADQLAQGNIYFRNDLARTRCEEVLGNAGIPDELFVVFSLNVSMLPSTYSPSQNVLQVLQDAADADFPMVANVYCDRFGRCCVHGRKARFDPDTTAVGADWIFGDWQAGDSAAVAAFPSGTAQIRQLATNRGLAKIFNSAYCTPNELAEGAQAGQYVQDATSIGKYGYGSWSAENLFVDFGTTTGNSGPDECKAFAQYVVDTFKVPHNRVSLLGLRTMAADWIGAAATWRVLTECDIGDRLSLTVGDRGGGGFTAEPFFIEGIHEQVVPLNPDMADVTLTLDISPTSLYPPDSPLMGPH